MMNEAEFSLKIEELDGELYIVGGWVRDKIRGAVPKDKDYVVCHVREDLFRECFPKAKKVGKSFPVYLVQIEGKNCEVAFARKERKQGHGYKGFAVEYDDSIDLTEDLWRRDTTMNAVAYRVKDGEIIDPYNGTADIKQGIIRAVSYHFADDPVRALRAARQASEFSLAISEDTIELMRLCGTEMKYEPSERILGELTKALGTRQPSVFFRVLQKADLLEILFPEIYALIGKTQPEYFHPEGDAFEHTMQIVDLVADMTNDIAVRFAGLVHDIGKGVTPIEVLPHHYGHERVGLDVLMQWNERMTLPRRWLQGALFVIKEHMRAARLAKAGKIVDLLLAIEKNPLGFAGFNCVILADSKCLPYYLADYRSYLAKIHNVSMKNCPENLRGKAIGDWIRQERIRAFNNYIED